MLQQYHANLTQFIMYKERHTDFCKIFPYANDIVNARFEDLRTFLYLSIRVVRVLMRYELSKCTDRPPFSVRWIEYPRDSHFNYARFN